MRHAAKFQSPQLGQVRWGWVLAPSPLPTPEAGAPRREVSKSAVRPSQMGVGFWARSPALPHAQQALAGSPPDPQRSLPHVPALRTSSAAPCPAPTGSPTSSVVPNGAQHDAIKAPPRTTPTRDLLTTSRRRSRPARGAQHVQRAPRCAQGRSRMLAWTKAHASCTQPARDSQSQTASAFRAGHPPTAARNSHAARTQNASGTQSPRKPDRSTLQARLAPSCPVAGPRTHRSGQGLAPTWGKVEALLQGLARAGRLGLETRAARACESPLAVRTRGLGKCRTRSGQDSLARLVGKVLRVRRRGLWSFRYLGLRPAALHDQRIRGVNDGGILPIREPDEPRPKWSGRAAPATGSRWGAGKTRAPGQGCLECS